MHSSTYSATAVLQHRSKPCSCHCCPRPKSTSSVIWPFLLYCTPRLAPVGHSRYALIGHHPKPGTEPIPPKSLPCPSHVLGISLSFAPQALQTSLEPSCTSESAVTDTLSEGSDLDICLALCVATLQRGFQFAPIDRLLCEVNAVDCMVARCVAKDGKKKFEKCSRLCEKCVGLLSSNPKIAYCVSNAVRARR